MFLQKTDKSGHTEESGPESTPGAGLSFQLMKESLKNELNHKITLIIL